MASQYERLRQALLGELHHAPHRDFKTLLAKATLHVSQKVKLTSAEEDELYQLYLKAHLDDERRGESHKGN